ncbi:MAG: HEAT repeat domain-containing protein, partial [Planctomycetota bacterium]|jgi:hypothetical protein
MVSLLRRLLVAVGLCLLVAGGAPPAAADDWTDARSAFREAQRLDEWKLRQAAYLQLLEFDDERGAAEVIRAMGREKNPAVLLTGIETLAGFRSQGALGEILDLLRPPKGDKGFYALLALAERTAPGGQDVLMEILQGKDEMFAAQAAIALGRKQFQEAIPFLLDLLGHESWQLRAAGARAIRLLAGPVPPDPAPGKEPEPWLPAWFRPDDYLGPLAEALAKGEGRERAEMIEALERISKQDFGYDVAAWRSLAAGTPPAQIRRRPEHPPYIFGIPIYGRRVVMILDNSVCNDDPHPFEERSRLQELCKVPGARDVPWYELRTTKQFYAAHTKRLINDLPSGDAKFDLVIFTGEVRPVFGKLTPVNPGTRARAIKVLEGLEVKNGVDSLGAFLEALDIAGRKDSAAWKQGPDEVIFMSCSIPWLAEVTDQDIVGATVALRAQRRMVPVHTIGVGPHPFVLMKIISPRSGGTYLDLSR